MATNSNILISIVSPIYKGEKMLNELVSRIEAAVNVITSEYEIILVNDSSPDNSWNKIKEICQTNMHVKGLNLSRNFGQHYAIHAGISNAQGKWVVVLDCDLQDRPEEIPNLYKKALEGYDTVFAEIVVRNDSFAKKMSSRIFYDVFAYFTNQVAIKKTSNFGIYNKKVIEAVLSMGDYIKCFPIAIRWVGFHIGYIKVIKDARTEGNSSYTWKKLISFAIDNITAFSNKPLRLTLLFGFFIVIISIIISFFYLLRYFMGGIAVDGFTTIVLSLWILGGIIITLIGMVGLYLGKVFDQTKNRPYFIISERTDSTSNIE